MLLSPPTAARIDHVVSRTQADTRAPALAVGVVRDGALAHTVFAGDTRPGPDSQWRIGSISKTFTATLVMALRDEGRLALDEPIGAHLGHLAVGSLTPRQLLAHVSGLRREPAGAWWERAEDGGIHAMLAAIGPEAALRPPFRTYHYSNLGYALLGAAVAAITGRTWYEELRHRVLTPLRMHRTTYAATEPFQPGYVIHPYDGTPREEPRPDTGAMAPAGQLWSSMTDLATWAAFLADPEGADPAGSVLAPATVDEMCQPVAIIDLVSWTAGHGLGIEMWRSGDRVYAGHAGSMPGYLAVIVAHRPSRTAVVAFANTYTLSGTTIAAVGTGLLDTVLDAERVPLATPWHPAPAAPSADIAALLGTWWWMGRRHDVIWDGELAVTEPDRHVPAWRFAPVGPDEWRCHSGSNDGETMRIRRDPDGTPVALDIATFIFTREAWPAEPL